MNSRSRSPWRTDIELRDAPEDYAPRCPHYCRGYCEKRWDEDYGARRCIYDYEDWAEECPVYLEDEE